MNPPDLSRRRFLARAGLGLAGATGWLAAARLAEAARPRRKPNILFFLVDDMGWMDSSLYGSQYYETPNIERLARRGMMFTNAYAANPLCSPTRASIMTGKYPGRLNIFQAACGLPPDPNHTDMPDSAPPWQPMILPTCRRFVPQQEHTLAEALGEVGYRTIFIGKWHMGGVEDYWPEAQGFDVNFGGGHYPGPPSYFSPYHMRKVPDGPPGEYLTDKLTDLALEQLEANRNGPFFMCLWHYAVHSPWQAKAELIENYEKKRDPRAEQQNPTMAAMLESMDQSLGRVIDKLDRLGIADDTIIVFYSDNGGVVHDSAPAGGPPITSNAPLRGGKAMLYEGGTREPAIVVWPGVVREGGRCDVPISSVDLYPTILEMAGAQPRAGQIVDGETIVPVLRGAPRHSREEIYCYYPFAPDHGRLSAPGVYVRQGDWKLIRFYFTTPGHPNLYELYNLKDDIGETNNLAGRHPERVAAMSALIDRHLAQTNAILPRPNPAYTPGAVNPELLDPVAGWRAAPHGQTTLTEGDGVLVVESTGADPWLYSSEMPALQGAFRVSLRIRSTIPGPGQLLWSAHPNGKRFTGAELVDFNIGGGGWKVIHVDVPNRGAAHGLRLDPGTAAGVAEIDWIRVSDTAGRLVHEWRFGRDLEAPPAAETLADAGEPSAPSKPSGPPRPVGDWIPALNKKTWLEQADGALRVISTSPDPWLFTRAVPRHQGPFEVALRLQTGIPGQGQFFWDEGTGFGQSTSMTFAIGPGGGWQEIRFRAAGKGPLEAIRFDPGAGPGVARIDWIRLTRPGGGLIKEWSFD